MPSIKFTAAKINFLEGVSGKHVNYFDKALPGFFLRVSQDGKKSFGVMYRHAAYPLLSLARHETKLQKPSEMQNSDRSRLPRNRKNGMQQPLDRLPWKY